MSDSTPPPIPAAPPIHPVVAALSDFSDRISPVMVKELRQGMRTRAFTSIFLILQVILAFAMFLALVADSGNIGTSISQMVFLLFAIVALILQPLRGTTAVATELKDATFEIMSLTRLSSMRIVLGKWASLVSQTALMLASIIPYLVMRYFFGGMQLFAELALLVTIFFLSACLTAMTVGLSCNRAVIVRALVPLFGVPFGLMGIMSLFIRSRGNNLIEVFTFQDPETNLVLGIFLLLSLYAGYYFLEMGVSRIARSAENHATRKRLVSLILMAITLGIFLSSDAIAGSIFVVLFFTCFIGLDVCTEDAVGVPRVVAPFVRKGPIGRLLGYILYPGWHTGLVVLTGLFFLTIFVGEATYKRGWLGSNPGLTEELIFVIIGIFYTILTPLLILRRFAARISNPFTTYIGILVLSGIFTILLMILTSVSRGDEAILLLFAWIPGVWMLIADNASVGEVLFMWFLLAIVWVILVVLAAQEFRTTRSLEARVRDLLNNDAA